MTETNASARNNTHSASGAQPLDERVLDEIVGGMDCSTAAKLQGAYFAAGAAMRAAGQSWIGATLEYTGRGIATGACK